MTDRDKRFKKKIWSKEETDKQLRSTEETQKLCNKYTNRERCTEKDFLSCGFRVSMRKVILAQIKNESSPYAEEKGPKCFMFAQLEL